MDLQPAADPYNVVCSIETVLHRIIHLNNTGMYMYSEH